MRIGLITTLNTNIGDDLIREGICLLLKELFGNREPEFVLVNKHQPLTAYPNWHPVQVGKLARYLPRGGTTIGLWMERAGSRLRRSHFDRCDLIVQCGAPVMWSGCHRSEWAEPLWYHVIGRLHRRIPVLNLAAGSCYPWEQLPTRITDPRDERFLKAILGYCRLTTVRDALAEHLCTTLDEHAVLVPCSAFLSARGQVAGMPDDGPVLISYMPGAGHFEWAQDIDPSTWRETVRTLICRLQMRHRLAFLCHNQSEYDLAQDLAPELQCLWPRTPSEYFSLMSEAKAALCNRLHASVGLASMGIPSVAVGTDSRMLMVKALGLPCLYVKEADAERLEENIEDLLAQRWQQKERLLAMRSETWARYIKVVSEAI